MAINWVWRSSSDSLRLKTISVLATAETLFSIGLYWGVAVYFNTFIHLWVSIALAPILLLRSPKSVKSGLIWFKKFQGNEISLFLPKGIYHVLHPLVLGFLALTCTYLFFTYWSGEYTGWKLFLHDLSIILLSSIVSALLYVAITSIAEILGIWPVFEEDEIEHEGGAFFWGLITGTIAGYITYVGLDTALNSLILIGTNLTDSILSIIGRRSNAVSVFFICAALLCLSPILFAPSIFIAMIGGFFFRTLVHSWIAKIIATLSYIKLGIRFLPRNWRESIFVIDLYKSPELLPGVSQIDRSFSLVGLLESRKEKKSEFTWSGMDAIVTYIFIGLYFGPAYWYRLSIKSTCWFWFPLAFLLNSPRHDRVGQKIFLKHLCRSSWGKILFRLAAGFMALSLLTLAANSHHFSLLKFPVELKLNGWEVYLTSRHAEWAVSQAWAWFCVFSSMLTLVMYYYADRILISIDEHENSASEANWGDIPIKVIETLWRLRQMALFCFCLIAGTQFTLFVWNVEPYLHPTIVGWLTDFYGNGIKE